MPGGRLRLGLRADGHAEALEEVQRELHLHAGLRFREGIAPHRRRHELRQPRVGLRKRRDADGDVDAALELRLGGEVQGGARARGRPVVLGRRAGAEQGLVEIDPRH